MRFTEKELEKIKKEKMKEIDKWLDNEYGTSYTRLEELHDFVVEQDLKHREEKDKEIERLQNIIKEVKEFVEWHYEDNKKFYKNKGIGLNYPECDAILEILDKGE